MKRLGILVWVLVLIAWGAAAQAPENCPPEARLMQGFPPPPEKQVTRGKGPRNWVWPHNSKWSYQHTCELVPNKLVARGITPVAELDKDLKSDLDNLRFDDGTGKQTTFGAFARDKDTDAIMVLHKGKIVYKHYGNCMSDESYHLLYSASKSFVGLVAAIMVWRKELDENAMVSKYVSELAGSAYGNAKVRDVMDMRVDVKFLEDYRPNLQSDIIGYMAAAGWIPSRPDSLGPTNLYEALESLKEKDQPSGRCFHYRSPSTDVLAWVVSRASNPNKSLSQLVSELIWSKIGAERDAYYLVDSVGKEAAFGGLNTTLADFARFGEMMRNKGKWNGQQVVPEDVIRDIMTGGDSCKVFPNEPTLQDWSYRSQWWRRIVDQNGACMANGVHGQRLYIDPKAQLVVAKFGSHPDPGGISTHKAHQNAFNALATALNK